MNKLISLVLMLGLAGCSVVGPGQKGVRITQGKLGTETLSSGWYLWVPFFTSVKTVSIRVQKTEDETEAATKDMQKVTAKIALNWHIDSTNLPTMLTTVGDEDDVVRQIINPAVSEVLKAATAKMTAEEVLTRRIELKKNIDESLVARLKTYNVIVDDVSLVNLNFTAEFNHAVESKQIAEQETKQAEYQSQKAEVDARAAVNQARGQAQSQLVLAKVAAESTLIKAKAQSEAQTLLKQTLTPEILRLEYLKTWNGQLPNVLTNGSSGLMFNIDPTKTVREEKPSTQTDSEE